MDRAALLARRAELSARLEAIRRDLRGGLSSDLEDQATQLENYDTLLEIARVAEAELLQIDAQLSERDG